MKEIKIRTDFIKLDQLLKFSALVQTGGEAKEVIQEGLVSVNEEICNQRGKKIRPGDIVEFNGEKIKLESEIK